MSKLVDRCINSGADVTRGRTGEVMCPWCHRMILTKLNVITNTQQFPGHNEHVRLDPSIIARRKKSLDKKQHAV